MNTNQKIRQMMEARQWTEYRLAKEAGLSQSTIANIYRRNTVPSVATLEVICKAFGITLSQFFCTGNIVELTDEQKEMFDRWVTLTPRQKSLLHDLMNDMT